MLDLNKVLADAIAESNANSVTVNVTKGITTVLEKVIAIAEQMKADGAG